eukprot:NODE_55_length_29507_cov_0.809712.p14 type:complete len:282 gc:universal NODE_55_length_29507_cov_0.809712:20782-19937(-)
MQKLGIAIEAVQVACKTISKLPKKINTKTDQSPVTLADFTSQAIITTMLNDNFISEESKPNLELRSEIDEISPVKVNWDIFDKRHVGSKGFILDPIDGTKGYIRDDQYAVCLAYFDGNVLFSIIGCPNLGFPSMSDQDRGTLMVAIKDKGCYQSSLYKPWDISNSLKCECKPLASLAQSFESSHVDTHDIDEFVNKHKIDKIVRMDSQAKYVIVARGEVGYYLRATPKSYVEKVWDHAAGYLAILEANGAVVQPDHSPVTIEYQKDLIVKGIIGCHRSLLM